MTDFDAGTGSEGFIGSHPVEALVECGCRVRAMVVYNMWNSCAWLDTLDRDVMDHVDVVFGDVRDPRGTRAGGRRRDRLPPRRDRIRSVLLPRAEVLRG